MTITGYLVSLDEQLKHIKKTRPDLGQEEQRQEAERVTRAFAWRMYKFNPDAPDALNKTPDQAPDLKYLTND